MKSMHLKFTLHHDVKTDTELIRYLESFKSGKGYQQRTQEIKRLMFLALQFADSDGGFTSGFSLSHIVEKRRIPNLNSEHRNPQEICVEKEPNFNILPEVIPSQVMEKKEPALPNTESTIDTSKKVKDFFISDNVKEIGEKDEPKKTKKRSSNWSKGASVRRVNLEEVGKSIQPNS